MIDGSSPGAATQPTRILTGSAWLAAVRANPPTMASAAMIERFIMGVPRSLDAFHRLVNQALIGVLCDIDMRLLDAELLLDVERRLQRLDVGAVVGIAIDVFVGEDPIRPAFCRHLGELGDNLHSLVMVLRIEIPALGADPVLGEIDERRAVLVDEGLARDVEDEFR